MDENEIAQLSDDQILEKLESAALADRLEHDEHFQILRNACKRMHDRGVFALKTVNPTDHRRIIQLQLMCQFYENIILTLITNFKKDAEAVFNEAVDAGILQPPPEKIGSTSR